MSSFCWTLALAGLWYERNAASRAAAAQRPSSLSLPGQSCLETTTWGLRPIPASSKAPVHCYIVCLLFWLRPKPERQKKKKKNTVMSVKQTHKRKNLPTVAPSGGQHLGHTYTHTHTLPPTCLLVSVLWLITVLLSVCFGLMTQCVCTHCVILPASQYWMSAELTSCEKCKKKQGEKKKPSIHVNLVLWWICVSKTPQKVTLQIMIPTSFYAEYSFFFLPFTLAHGLQEKVIPHA